MSLRRLVIAVTLVVILSVAGINRTRAEAKGVYIRFANAVADIDAMDIYVNKEKVFSGLTAQDATPYFHFDAGQLAVNATLAGKEPTTEGEAAKYEDGHQYIYVYTGKAAQNAIRKYVFDAETLLKTVNTANSIPKESTPVLFAHDITDLPLMDLDVGGQVLLSKLPPGSVGITYIPWGNNSYVGFYPYASGDAKQAPVASAGMVLVPNAVQTVILTGTVAGKDVSVAQFTSFVGTAQEYLDASAANKAIGAGIFGKILSTSGLMDGQKKPVTLLVPTDLAIQKKYSQAELDKLTSDKAAAAAFVTLHALPERFTLNGLTTPLFKSSDSTFTKDNVDGTGTKFIFDQSKGLLVNKDTQMIVFNIETLDGVIHLINGVVEPLAK